MEPGYHLGDLVIVRPQLDYDIGDAVAYRDLDLGRIVFHRIVKQDVDGYILKGDHNSWVDSYHPISGQILGKAWIHLPGIGKAVAWLRTPIVLTAIVSLTAGTLLVGWFIQPKRRRVRGRD